MGGASQVLTGDTREEAIKKAKEWYSSALSAGIFPRDYIYGKGETEIEFNHCKNPKCHCCEGKPMKASVHVVDTTQKPKDANVPYPFPFFSGHLNAEQKAKRWFCFVSAHA
jgi:hypothetical protein